MRFAVGVDIVEMSRIGRLLAEHPGARDEIFTRGEQLYCAGKKQGLAHLAARFAAKEAFFKALGTGLGEGMRWTDVEVRHDALGRPRLELHGKPEAVLSAKGGRVEISLSHTAGIAIAHAVVLYASSDGST